MASKQQIQFWNTFLKRKTGAKESLDDFLTTVMENPESFELFVKHVRAATYPDERDAAPEPDAGDRILGPGLLHRDCLPRVKKCHCYLISL